MYVYNESQERKSEKKDLKNWQFGQKSQCKVEAKESMISEETSIILKSQALCIGTI
jgi:hypothetical protein